MCHLVGDILPCFATPNLIVFRSASRTCLSRSELYLFATAETVAQRFCVYSPASVLECRLPEPADTGGHMASKSAEQEIAQLEKQYWQGIKDKDMDTCERLTDFPCLVSGAH